MAKKFPAKRGEFTYSIPIVEEFGAFPATVNGKEFILVVASVKKSVLHLDPDNPRLWGDDDANGNFSKAGQTRMVNVLAGESETLKEQMEANGGQNNDLLWSQFQDGRPVTVEGNRRLAICDWDTVNTLILPDQMTKEEVFDLIAQKHVSGILNWSSSVRSEAAYNYLAKRGMGIEDIKIRLQFKSIAEAEKYIHAFVWWKESGCDRSEWSKFHHLYVPSNVRHFGYDKDHWKNGSTPFKEDLRQPANSKDRTTPQQVDEIVAKAAAAAGQTVPKNFKSDFYWACKLVENGQYTDCRQGDGIIAPAIREADMPYGPEMLKLLQTKPKNKRSSSEKEDGVGGIDPDSPAQAAWNYRKQSRQQNHLTTKLEYVQGELTSTMKSTIRMEQYLEDTPENKVLRGVIIGLQGQLDMFLKKMEKATK